MKNAFNDLVSKNIGLIHSIINKHSSKILRIFEYDDAFQLGCIGLIKAAKNYEENKNIAFSTYAYTCIYNYIMTQIRIEVDKRRNIIINSLDELVYEDNNKLNLLDVIADDLDIEQNHIYNNQIDILYQYINELPELQKNIMLMRCNYKTFKEIAKEYNVSDAYIQQQYQKALNKLRYKFFKNGDNYYE